MCHNVVLICNRPTLEKWSPDFSSSEQANPIWTRITSGETELCNSLESTEWMENPVQVQICDACGTVGCASGGYIHLSAIEDYVFWTIPQSDKVSEGIDAPFPATALVKFGAVAFPNEAWERLHAAEYEVPEARCISRANGLALIDAWAVGPGRPQAVERLLPMLRARLLACETLEPAAAIEWIERWLNWFQSRANLAVDGSIVSPDLAKATIETLYFDGPRGEDWPALARFGEGFVPVLDPTHIFVPAGYDRLGRE
jgi:hypothetical protein